MNARLRATDLDEALAQRLVSAGATTEEKPVMIENCDLDSLAVLAGILGTIPLPTLSPIDRSAIGNHLNATFTLLQSASETTDPHRSDPPSPGAAGALVGKAVLIIGLGLAGSAGGLTGHRGSVPTAQSNVSCRAAMAGPGYTELADLRPSVRISEWLPSPLPPAIATTPAAVPEVLTLAPQPLSISPRVAAPTHRLAPMPTVRKTTQAPSLVTPVATAMAARGRLVASLKLVDLVAKPGAGPSIQSDSTSPEPVRSAESTTAATPTTPPAWSGDRLQPLQVPTPTDLPYALREAWELTLVEPSQIGFQDFEPLDVALDARGRTYVADGRHNIVRLYDASGAMEAVLHSPFDLVLPGRYMVPTSISVDSQRGVVAILWRAYGAFDRAGSGAVVDLRQRDGSPILSWPALGTTDIAFHRPSGDLLIAVSGVIRRVSPKSRTVLGETYTQARLGAAGSLDVTADGRAVFLNPFTGGVVVSSSEVSPAFVLNLGGAAARAVAVDDADRIHVLVSQSGPGQADAPLILSFDPAGRLLQTMTVGGLGSAPLPANKWPWTLAVSPDGMVLTTGDSAYRIERYDPAMARLWSLIGGTVRPDFAFFPTDNRKSVGIPIVARDDGTVLVLDNSAQRLITLDHEGRMHAAEDLPAVATDLTADAAETYVSFPGGQVWRGSLGTAAMSPWLNDCACGLGGRLALAPDTLFVSQPRGRQIGAFDRVSGALRQSLQPADVPGLWPADLAIGPNRQLVTADMPAGRVQLWNEALEAGQAWSTRGSLGPARVAGGRLADGTPVIAALTADGLVELRGLDGAVVTQWRPGDDGSIVLVPDDIAMDTKGTVYVSDALRQAVLVYDPADANAPSPTPRPTPLPACTLSGDKIAAPDRLQLGDTAVITLTLRAGCPGLSTEQSDIMLVVDRSGSMDGAFDTVIKTAHGFLSMLDMRRHRVGLVTFADSASLDVPLTDDPIQVIDELERITFGPATSIASGLIVAERTLRESGREDARPIVVLLTDGQSTVAGEALPVARAMMAHGIEIFAIGLGEDTDRVLLRAIAGDESHHYHATTAGDLRRIYTEILRHVVGVSANGAVIDDIMGAGIDLVPGSSRPVAIESAAGLFWRIDDLPRTGITLTYRVRPRRAGWLETNERAAAVVAESSGASGTFVFPIPRVEVIAPTPSETTRPSATAPPTAAASPTRAPKPLYLPVVLGESCSPMLRRVDVVLVIDASSSMLSLTSAGRSKLGAALEAAQVFLDQLRFVAGDRAAIVMFNSEAVLVSPLTTDRRRLDVAIDSITTAPQTRLDRGIALARMQFGAQEQQTTSASIIIVLTDGRANPVPVEVAVAEAGQAKALGIQIFTVGVGTDLDILALRDIASRPEWYFAAADAESLTGIYRSIALTIPCLQQAYWGNR